MKNLLKIDESEKKRILGLHENVLPKKVNLSEQWWEEEPPKDKWQLLEMDIRKSMDKIIDNHKHNWGNDQYNVMGAIEEIMEGLFQKVQIR
jgi:hypothetical protein